MLLGGIMTAGAQESYGGYSPYTIFGVGDLALQGSTYNKSMGGVGIAGRNNRYLNIMNPAAVTARDSLSFMSSFSLNVNNRIYRQGDAISANNIFNINDVVISFPIQRASAMMLGIVPYSDVGYEFSEIYTDPELVGSVGDVGSAATGIGSVYKAFAAAGVTFLKRISIGAEMDYYFGKITKSYVTKFGDSSYQSISNNNVLQLNGIGGKFGLQYEQPFGNDVSLVLGATYSTGAKLRGYFEDSRYSEGTASIDTISFRIDTMGVTRHASLASEIGVGISLKKTNKWMFEADYTRSDWRNSGMENISGYNLSSIPSRPRSAKPTGSDSSIFPTSTTYATTSTGWPIVSEHITKKNISPSADTRSRRWESPWEPLFPCSDGTTDCRSEWNSVSARHLPEI